MHNSVYMDAVETWPVKSSSYRLEYVIGMGSFGLVWRAVIEEGFHSGKAVAIKIINLDQFEDLSIAEIRKESSIMGSSKHKNIVKEHATFIDGAYMWIVMTILDTGSCIDIMRLTRDRKAADGGAGIRDERLVASILRDTMEGLRYFH
jgi:serine/threonine-protein kinase 24/25/MST4